MEPVKADKPIQKQSVNLTNGNKESSAEAKEIINRINEDLLMLSYQTDPNKIKVLKSVTQEDYQKLLKCSNVSKSDIEKIEKRIVDMFLTVGIK